MGTVVAEDQEDRGGAREERCGQCGEVIFLEFTPSGVAVWVHYSARLGIPSDHPADPVGQETFGPLPDWTEGPLDLHEWHPDNLGRADVYALVYRGMVEAYGPEFWVGRSGSKGRQEEGPPKPPTQQG